MTRLRLATDPSRRRGFTLIELLVVISIIAVLLSLIAPAVQNARRAARRMECQSHMHNLAIAVQNFASTNNAQLPPLVGAMTVAKFGSTTTSLRLVHNWVIPLLPLIDESALYRSIREAATDSGVADPYGSTNLAAVKASDQIAIKVLACPEDQNNVSKAKGLSYAANAGYMNNALWAQDTGFTHYLYTVNFNGNTTWIPVAGSPTTTAADSGDATLAVATGVFWRQYGATYSTSDPRVTLDSIGVGDGLTQTLMFAENLNSTDWTSPNINTCAFAVGVDETTPIGAAALWGATSPWSYSPNAAAPPTFGDVPVPATSPTIIYHSARLNSQPLTGAGIPRPSSAHLGAVNFVFCDGSVRAVNENVDAGVYIRLVTPDGKTYGQPLVDSTSY